MQNRACKNCECWKPFGDGFEGHCRHSPPTADGFPVAAAKAYCITGFRPIIRDIDGSPGEPIGKPLSLAEQIEMVRGTSS